jgi:4-carboxymuconolactone decarboxylase
LVHFGQLVALGSAGPAHLHARAARKAGATIADLVGVAELALITAGMPSYSLGVQIVADLLAEEDGKVDEGGQVGEDGFLAGDAIRPTETQRAAT